MVMKQKRTLADFFEMPIPVVEGKAFELLLGGKILDVGCGIGYVLSKFAESGATLIGLDPSKKSLEEASKYLNGQLLKATAESIPLPDDYVDYILFADVIKAALHDKSLGRSNPCPGSLSPRLYTPSFPDGPPAWGYP